MGHGSNCTHPTRPPARTRPPPTQFEINLFKNIIHGIDDRLALSRARGIPVKTAIRIFSTQDHTHKVYVRNKDCWAYGLDLTSISPWNSDFRNKKAGTLISPRHVLWARHYSIHINKTIRYGKRELTFWMNCIDSSISSRWGWRWGSIGFCVVRLLVVGFFVWMLLILLHNTDLPHGHFSKCTGRLEFKWGCMFA